MGVYCELTVINNGKRVIDWVVGVGRCHCSRTFLWRLAGSLSALPYSYDYFKMYLAYAEPLRFKNPLIVFSLKMVVE